MILYNFFKNIMICFPQWWWGITNFFSGQTLYEKYHYQLYNVVYTSFPIIVYAVWDQEFSSEQFFLERPLLYSKGPKRELFNNIRFVFWFVVATIEAALIVMISLELIDMDWTNEEGTALGFWVFGMVVFSSVCLLVNIKIFAFSNTFSILHVVILIGSTVAVLVTWPVIGAFFKGNE